MDNAPQAVKVYCEACRSWHLLAVCPLGQAFEADQYARWLEEELAAAGRRAAAALYARLRRPSPN